MIFNTTCKKVVQCLDTGLIQFRYVQNSIQDPVPNVLRGDGQESHWRSYSVQMPLQTVPFQLCIHLYRTISKYL